MIVYNFLPFLLQTTDSFYDSILEFLQYDEELKAHLARERCFLVGFKSDGSSFSDALSDLEKHIVSIAKQSRWTESIPTDWATSEIILREIKKRGDKICTVETLSQKCFGASKENNAQIGDFLRFYHDIGVLLHFDTGSLSENVITDVQWFVDSFKKIMTDLNHAKDAVSNKSDWRAFYQNGHIKDNLLVEIWKSQKMEIDSTVKATLLQYMERLGLICTGQQVHYIPCMNKLTFGIKEKQHLLSIQSRTSVLVFRFHFLPYFLYFRLIVACLTTTNREWTIVEDKGLCLFKNLAYFHYKQHVVVLAVNKYSIQIQVFQPSNASIEKKVTLEVRGHVERTLNDCLGNFHKELMYTIGYQCSKQEVFNELDGFFVAENEIKGKGDIACPRHGMQSHHILKQTSLLFHWNKVFLFTQKNQTQ
jgi:hypothetical protein